MILYKGDLGTLPGLLYQMYASSYAPTSSYSKWENVVNPKEKQFDIARHAAIFELREVFSSMAYNANVGNMKSIVDADTEKEKERPNTAAEIIEA